jgi:hypothetical protein
MNNSKIKQEYNTTAGFGVVNYVQVQKVMIFFQIIQFKILGDASGDMIQLQKTPMECKFRMSIDKLKAENTLNITGKVLNESGTFTIELKYKGLFNILL